MAVPVVPTPSNFLAVALVINRSRDGPRFVFHYPPHVAPMRARDGEGAPHAEVDDEGDLFLERAFRQPSLDTDAGVNLGINGHHAPWKQDEHVFTESGSQVVPWEYVAGFPTKDLESILTPARAYHKRLFQVSLDPLYFVSYPIYAPEGGKWKKRKKVPVKEDPAASLYETDAKDGSAATQPSDVEHSESRGAAKQAPGPSVAEEVIEEKPSSMTMFNLVFILNPPRNEARDLLNTMFVHIIKKTNKAYKYCQQRSDFVWRESKKILALKDKAREDQRSMSSLWGEILATSSLAASMHDIYEAISQNKIATLQLDAAEGPVAHSVQIPMPFHTADLPEEGQTNLRGLWLTTANAFLDDEHLENPAFLDKNFALLLLEDEQKIIAELQAGDSPPLDETTQAMIEFVRHCKPTSSFHQVAQQSGRVLSASQVRKFAQHFIFWRRAVAIPPLHARDMYVLSPNCDPTRLPRAALEWQRQFPLAPDLPRFLADLSAAPRPYKAFCPYKAHRPLYLAMLGWLMRDGWVTQLCTFAYVVVWPEIIYEVDHALEADEIARAKRSQSHGRFGSETGASEDGNRDRDRDRVSAEADEYASSSSPVSPRDRRMSSSARSGESPTTTTTTTATTTRGRHGNTAHPPAHSRTNSPPPPHVEHSSTNTSFSSSQTHAPATAAEQAAEQARLDRLAARAERELAEKATAHARRAAPTPTRHPSVNHAPHLAGLSPYIIVDANKATGRESLFLSAIGRRLRRSAEAAAAAAAAAASSTGKEADAKDKAKREDRAGGGGGGGAGSDPSRNNVASSGSGGPQGPLPSAPDWDARVADAWPAFCKYFNGRSALERVALQEDMKRKEAWNLLTAMSEYLLCVRHW